MTTFTDDTRFLGREGRRQELQVARAKGSYTYDQRGRKYIDFDMGWCVGNTGWNPPEVVRALKKFKGPQYVNPDYVYKPWVELAQLLAKIAPGNLRKSFRVTGGTEAVELALQAAMTYTKRSQFISIEGAYHGHSIGALSIGSSDMREKFRNLLPDCHKVKPPLDAEAAEEVERMLSTREVAAYISEPTICNLGVCIPDREYYDIVQAACKKYGTLFIADEVATGFGRTGKMFASEHYDLEPDIMCVAKAVNGGFGGLGAVMMTDAVYEAIKDDFSFYSTFGWNPLSVHATIANLKYLIKNKTALLKNANAISSYFKDRLEEMDYMYPAEVRVQGLAISIIFSEKDYVEQVIDTARKKGLLLAHIGAKKIAMFPALNIPRTVAKEGLDLFESCL